MKIKEIMNTNLKWVTPNTDLKKAAEIMQKYDVGVVPVCNDNLSILQVLLLALFCFHCSTELCKILFLVAIV